MLNMAFQNLILSTITLLMAAGVQHGGDFDTTKGREDVAVAQG